jgi:hypothetical protein
MSKADRRASGLAAQFRFGWRAIQRHSGKSALLKRKAKREEVRAAKAKAEAEAEEIMLREEVRAAKAKAEAEEKAEEIMFLENIMLDSLIWGWEIKIPYKKYN